MSIGRHGAHIADPADRFIRLVKRDLGGDSQNSVAKLVERLVPGLRAGVYMFFDLVMAGIDVCTVDDIALSVLTTVIGNQPTKGWTMIDAGWMALSRDRGTASQDVDQGYGLVCEENGRVLPDLIVSSANQEHGTVSLRPGADKPVPDLPVGTRLRILPNHACATAAQHDRYNVLPQDGGSIQTWHRFGGW